VVQTHAPAAIRAPYPTGNSENAGVSEANEFWDLDRSVVGPDGTTYNIVVHIGYERAGRSSGLRASERLTRSSPSTQETRAGSSGTGNRSPGRRAHHRQPRPTDPLWPPSETTGHAAIRPDLCLSLGATQPRGRVGSWVRSALRSLDGPHQEGGVDGAQRIGLETVVDGPEHCLGP
jgi:hypothetical protein